MNVVDGRCVWLCCRDVHCNAGKCNVHCNAGKCNAAGIQGYVFVMGCLRLWWE